MKERNMSKQIAIVYVKNACDLDSFTPVEGGWSIVDATSSEREDISIGDIEDAVSNHMGAGYPLDVKI